MKIVGVFNAFGCSPLKTSEMNKFWPYDLNVVYQDENGKHYIKYLNSGDIGLLLQKFEQIKNQSERDVELELFINGGRSKNGNPHIYSPIKNEYCYEQILIKESQKISNSYCELSQFPQEKVKVEPGYKTDSQSYVSSVIFPSNKELYIGSGEFIYTKASHNFSVENKKADEIQGIIYFLIQLMYLDEAQNIIDKIRSSGINLDEYKHLKSSFVSDGSDNFLDQQENRIEAMNYVKEKTKSLNLHFFKK